MPPQGFFTSLFDFSFSQLITPKVIRFLYGLMVVLAGLYAISMIVFGFQVSSATGVLMLVLSPVMFFLWVIATRVWLEIVIVIFRISQHTEEIAKQRQSEP